MCGFLRESPGGSRPAGVAFPRRRDASTGPVDDRRPALRATWQRGRMTQRSAIRKFELTGPFTRRDALEGGLSDRQLQGDDFRRLFQGVYVPCTCR